MNNITNLLNLEDAAIKITDNQIQGQTKTEFGIVFIDLRATKYHT